MKVFVRTDRFKKLCRRLPAAIQTKVKRQLRALAEDVSHPSLHTKRIKGRQNVWEARVDIHHRMTFHIDGDRVILRAVGPHDVLKRA
jgi:mRNA-degrading endonuclease RelE of RelBE toxin-antitoxin system